MLHTQTTTVQSFEAFFALWLIHQERYLHDLLRVIECGGDDQRSKDLVDQIAAHYGEYYRARSEVIREDVFLVIRPTWFTSFERAHLWIGGFRPGLAFRLLTNNVADLTDDQSERINRLMAEILEEEKRVSDDFDRVEEEMMVEVGRQAGRPLNRVENSMESAIDRLKLAMENLVECADLLRKKIGVALLVILKPSQAVRFLAAVATLQLKIRKWGMQMDTQRSNSETCIASCPP